MHWMIYVMMAVAAFMVISMFVITFKDLAESRRTQKLYEKLEPLSKQQSDRMREVDRALQNKEQQRRQKNSC